MARVGVRGGARLQAWVGVRVSVVARPGVRVGARAGLVWALWLG